jgi:hypothetical protein
MTIAGRIENSRTSAVERDAGKNPKGAILRSRRAVLTGAGTTAATKDSV